jgi:hypothetical protein
MSQRRRAGHTKAGALQWKAPVFQAKVLQEKGGSAGTARPHLSRTSDARKSVVAVARKALRAFFSSRRWAMRYNQIASCGIAGHRTPLISRHDPGSVYHHQR